MRNHHQAWTLAATLAALLALAACGIDSDDNTSGDDEAAATTTSPDTTTTTAPEQATTTTVATEGPEEWVEVVQDLYGRWSDLLADPDPDRVNELIAETCECWDDNHGTVDVLAAEGDHIEGPPTQVLFVKHENTDEDLGLVDLTVKIHTDELQRVDADGEPVQEISSGDPDGTCWALSILPDGPDGAWRFYSKLALTGCPEGS